VEETRARLDAVYAEHAPQLDRVTTVACGAYAERVHEDDDRWSDLDDTPGFSPPARIVVEWRHVYSRPEWIDQLRTHSDHALLPTDTRERLLAAIGATLDEHGGSIEIAYTSYALVVRRSA
jgi:hypothetical protein